MLSEQLDLDQVDQKIFTIIQSDPTVSHTRIAEQVSRSQPTVGMRIRKLEENGLLKYQAGLDLKTMNFQLAKIGIQTNTPERIIEEVDKCPYLINGFLLSGLENMIIIAIGAHLKDFEKIINYHFRCNPFVIKTSFELITGTLNNFVIPVNFEKIECKCLNS